MLPQEGCGRLLFAQQVNFLLCTVMSCCLAGQGVRATAVWAKAGLYMEVIGWGQVAEANIFLPFLLT